MESQSNIVYEAELTKSQVQEIHRVGHDWIDGYDPKLRSKWERALYLWAWEDDVVLEDGRRDVPVGK